MYKMSHRIRLPKPSEEQPATVDDIVLKQQEQEKLEKNNNKNKRNLKRMTVY